MCCLHSSSVSLWFSVLGTIVQILAGKNNFFRDFLVEISWLPFTIELIHDCAKLLSQELIVKNLFERGKNFVETQSKEKQVLCIKSYHCVELFFFSFFIGLFHRKN